MKSGKKVVRPASLFLAIILITLLSAPAEAQKFYKFGAADVSSAWFPIGSALSSLVTENVKGVGMSTTFGGAVKNLNVINGDPSYMGFTFGGKAYDAWVGEAPFKGKLQNVRGMFSVGPWVLQIIMKDKHPQRTFREIVKSDLNWAPSEIGMGTEVTARRLLALENSSYEKLKSQGASVHFVGRKDQVYLMQNGKVDLIWLMAPPPHPAVIEVQAHFKIRCIELESDLIEALNKKYSGYVQFTIPPGVFKDQKNEVRTVAELMFAACHKDVPDDDVYAITKTFWENLDTVKTALPLVAPFYDPKNPVKGVTVPIHPGAERYYKEKGLSLKP